MVIPTRSRRLTRRLVATAAALVSAPGVVGAVPDAGATPARPAALPAAVRDAITRAAG